MVVHEAEASWLPLKSLELSNQCVVVCDLRRRLDADSPAWRLVRGSQEEVGEVLAAIVAEAGIGRIEDFGGVCKTFLCEGEEYVESPPRIAGAAGVFSFTPKNRLAAEGEPMARVAREAGYRLLVLTVQKHDKFGKVWVLCGLLRKLAGPALTYYEDTDSVVDELKASAEGEKVFVVHVQAPGFEDCISRLADRVVTQEQYRQEVLESRREV